MTSINLSGKDWLCGAAARRSETAGDLSQVAEWLPAAVPGDVRLALLAAGRIPDPFCGMDDEKSRWVEDFDWWFKKDFTLEAPPGKRAHLVFEGIDYIAEIYLNGAKLGRHEGMFSRQTYEVTHLLRRENSVAVRLQSAKDLPKMALSRVDRVWQKLAKHLLWADLFPDRLATLKCQMSYGWDFAPKMLTAGIWDDACLHFCDSVRIQDFFVWSELGSGDATVKVRAELNSAGEVACELIATVEGIDFASQPLVYSQAISLPSGNSVRELTLRLASPRLWQPWDRGEPCLYRLRLAVQQGQHLLDRQETTFGVRSIEMVPNLGAPSGSAPLTLVINGEKEFIRGANWVPADSLFARVTAEDYAQLISMAKAAHVNMLRVWGGGLREKKAFYDLCDAAGIMVWQEFPLACAFFDHYPSDDGFVRLVEQEAAGIVRSLRNHPSLVIWCGGNEFAPSKNRRLVKAMNEAVAGLDGTRPFFPASPGKGDGHNWRVWHGKANVRDYRADKSLLASEFGLQAAPDVSSLVRFLPDAALYPPGKEWEHHNAQLDKLSRYAAPFAPEDLGSFVEATQKAQALGLQVAVEHFRRRKGYTSGTLVWQLNEPWPSICWSLIDYFRQPKRAYRKLEEIYSPVLVSLSYPLKKYRSGDTFEAEVWGINDLLLPFSDCRLRLLLGDATVHTQALSLAPNSATLVGRVAFQLDRVGEIRLELTAGEEVSSRNSYDLSYFDPQEISRWDAIRHWVAWRVLK